MARPPRLLLEDGIYHVTLRGNERREIFYDDADRQRFIRTLGQSVETFQVRLLLYCLMTNHVHLVLQTPRANLSAFMHRLQTAYTVYFNRRHRRSGHLVQGRFGASLVQEEGYLLKLSRYVHLNPVFVGAKRRESVKERIRFLRTYPWSSYRAYIGKADREEFMDYQKVLGSISPDPVRQKREYGRFVEAGIEDVDAAFIEDKRASMLCLGTEAFRGRIRGLYGREVERHKRKEDVSYRRGMGRLTVDQVLDAVVKGMRVSRKELLRRQRLGWGRPIAARMLTRYGGLSQRQVAEVLGVGSGAAVSIQLRRLADGMMGDKAIRRQVEAIERGLEEDYID